MIEFVRHYQMRLFGGVLVIPFLIGLIFLYSEGRKVVRNKKKWKTTSVPAQFPRDKNRRKAA